jgi:hypothetical protein
MVPLTTTASSFEARVLAAHLGAEGIVWELRGNVDGPYPVGPVMVLVAEDDLAVAREVVTEQHELAAVDPELAAVDVDADVDVPDAPSQDVPSGRPARARWVVLAMVVLAAATLLGRLLTLTWH